MTRGVPFKKGDDPRRNTEGRRTGARSFTTIVKEALSVMSGIKDDDGNELTMEQVLAKKVVADAIKSGDTALRRLVWNYMDGMPQQKMDITSGGETIQTPIYGGISGHNSDEEDLRTEKKD